MNLNVKDAGGGLLLVPQFTLAADTNSGLRPSFTPAANPEQGKRVFDYFVNKIKALYQNPPPPISIAAGQFGANMQVSLCNDGPVTFILKV
jgi:D-tyrosyl-tRNA(Tyr) deacylase